MEGLIRQVLDPILRRFISTKAELTVSLLKGRGVLRNLVVNVDEVNNFMEGLPIRFAHIGIDQMSIKASVTRMSTQPIIIYINKIDIEVYEPTPGKRSSSKKPSSTTNSNSSSKPSGGWATPPPPPSASSGRRPYGMTDRITDGIRIEVNEVRVHIRTLGKRKCPKPGPWNPADGLLVLRKICCFSTDEVGSEGDLEECWRYNKGRKPEYFLFKKLSVESMSFSVVPRRTTKGGGVASSPILVLSDTPFECTIVVKRNLYDVTRVLGVDMDMRLDRARMRLARADGSFNFFASYMIGALECVTSKYATKTDDQQLLDIVSMPERLRSYSLSTTGAFSPSSMLGSRVDDHEEEDDDEEEEGGGGPRRIPEDGEQEDSEGSDDSGFSQGRSSSLPADFSLADDLGSIMDMPPEPPPPPLGPSTAPASATVTTPHMRVSIAMSVARGEVRLVDDGVGGFQISFDNLRGEMIHTEMAAPAELIEQVRLAYFDVKELGPDEEILLQPALVRPCYIPHAAPAFDTVFPTFEPRGVRDPADFPDDDGNDNSMHSSNVLDIRNSIAAYPPPPPPAVAAELQVNLDRLHVVLDMGAWVRLANFITANLDWRCLTGEWGPEVEGFLIQNVPGNGVTNLTLRGAGVTVHLPPAPLATDSFSRGTVIEASVGKFAITISEALPRSFDSQAGFLDRRLLSSDDSPANEEAPAPPTQPTDQQQQARVDSLASFRLKVTLSDVCLVAPYLDPTAGPVTLLEPTSIAFLMSIDALSPTFEPPDETVYVPLSSQSQLTVSAAVDTLAIHFHLPAFLALADAIMAHLETLQRCLVVPPDVPPSPIPGVGPTPVSEALMGAGLAVVLKLCTLRLVLPRTFGDLSPPLYCELMEMQAKREHKASSQDRHIEKGTRAGVHPAALFSLEVGNVQLALKMEPRGSTIVKSLIGHCRLATTTRAGTGQKGDVMRKEVLLDFSGGVEWRGDEQLATSSLDQACSGHDNQDKPGQQPKEESPGGGIVVHLHHDVPKPSSERNAFFRDQGALDQVSLGLEETRVSIRVEGAAVVIRTPLPVIQASIEDVHAMLYRHAGPIRLPALSDAAPQFPEGSVGHLLASCFPVTPLSPSPGGPRRDGVLHVELLSEAIHVQVPLEPAPDHHHHHQPPEDVGKSLLLAIATSAGLVRGRLLLPAARGGAPTLASADEARESTWEVEGNVGLSLHGVRQGVEQHQSPACQQPVVREFRGKASASLGEAGDWKVLCWPPSVPLALQTSPELDYALGLLQVDLARLVAKGQALFAPTAAVLVPLDLAQAAWGTSAQEPVALSEGATSEDLVSLERLESSLRDKLQATARQARRQATAVRKRVRSTVLEVSRSQEQMGRKVAALRAALDEKEMQRQNAVAMHYADHRGFLRVGPQPGKGGQVKAKGSSSKALLSLPRLWCVLRKDVLICYDRPHSLQVEETFPLRHCVLTDYHPHDSASSRHGGRAHALVYRARTDAGGRPFLLVAESEEDLSQWKLALEPHLLPSNDSRLEATTRARPPLGRSLSQQPTMSIPETPQSRRKGVLGRPQLERTASSKVLKHSFSTFSASRLLKGGGGGGGGKKAASNSRIPRSLSDVSEVVGMGGGGVGEGGGEEQVGLASLRREAERVQQVEVTVRGVTTAAKEAGGGGKDPAPCYLIACQVPPAWARGRPGGLTSKLMLESSMRPFTRKLSPALREQQQQVHEDAIMLETTTSPLRPTANDGGVGFTGGGLEACVARTWAELLAFHGRQYSRWAHAIEEAEALGRLAPSSGGGREHSHAFWLQPSTGMTDVEALQYANQLLLGAQKALQVYSNAEAGRRQQADTVERYLHIVVSCCPVDRECLSQLTSFLGLDASSLFSSSNLHSPSSRNSVGEVTAPARAFWSSIKAPPVGGDDLRFLAPDELVATRQADRAFVVVKPVPTSPRSLNAMTTRREGQQGKGGDEHHHHDEADVTMLMAGVGGKGLALFEDRRLREEVESLRRDVVKMDKSLRAANLALTLQSSLFDEYVCASKKRQSALARQVEETARQCDDSYARATYLEHELSSALLGRDDALLAVTEVTSYCAKKLIDAEQRYVTLLKTVNKARPHKVSHHHSTSMPSVAPPPTSQSTSSSSSSSSNNRRVAASVGGDNRQQALRHQHQHLRVSSSSPGPIQRGGSGEGGGLPRRRSGNDLPPATDDQPHPGLASYRGSSSRSLGGDEAAACTTTSPSSSSSSSSLDRLNRALEQKTLEVCGAMEGLDMAMEEVGALRVALTETRRLAAMAGGDHGGVPSPCSVGAGGVSVEERVHVLQAEVRRERARADALEAELRGAKERWRVFTEKATEHMAQGGGQEEEEDGGVEEEGTIDEPILLSLLQALKDNTISVS